MINVIFYLMCLLVIITTATLWVLFKDDRHQDTARTKNQKFAANTR